MIFLKIEDGSVLREVSMVLKRVSIFLSITLSIVFILVHPIFAQLNPIYRFKDISIPVSLKINDSILEKGTYSLEFCRASSGPNYSVRIMKGKEILFTLPGEEHPYNRAKDNDIPNKPTLKMNRNQSEKLLILVFESGIWTKTYPRIRVRFTIQYEE
jgi:hypothetical protein